MRLYFIRHGQTLGNREHRYVGRTDEGILEMEKERLRKKAPYFPEMDMVFVSPYLRCRQTAEILFSEETAEHPLDISKWNPPERGKSSGKASIASGWKSKIETVEDFQEMDFGEFEYRKSKIEIVEDFREMDFGEFEYRNYQELAGNPDYQRFIDSGGAAGFPGGEELGAFKERCCSAFGACIRKAWENDWRQVGFVVHGGTIMAVLEAFSYPHKEYYAYQAGNGCGYVMELEIDGNKPGPAADFEKNIGRDSIKLTIKEEIT